ncbi:MAG: 2Fe-2S iron-sulfur cluster-binding protein [Rhodobacterales bacterium]
MCRHTVTLRNRGGVSFIVGEDESIINVVEAAGHILPIACRYGGCITCAARIISGSVRQPKGTALNKRQSEEGYVLLCVARPNEDCVFDVGVESHDKLYVNPFASAASVGQLARARKKWSHCVKPASVRTAGGARLHHSSD